MCPTSTPDPATPVLSGLQRQGDLLLIPSEAVVAHTDVLADGTAIVRGQSGGNTHTLIADGPPGCVRCDLDPGSGTDIAALVVEPDAAAYMMHPEHAALGIGPGRYVIRRQRELADDLRSVQD
jgi:hypothetical protein